MPETQARSGDLLQIVEASEKERYVRAVPFQFTVTWSSLYASFPETSAAGALENQKREAWNRPPTKAEISWSMVVPKMQRTPHRRGRVLELPAPPPAPATPVPPPSLQPLPPVEGIAQAPQPPKSPAKVLGFQLVAISASCATILMAGMALFFVHTYQIVPRYTAKPQVQPEPAPLAHVSPRPVEMVETAPKPRQKPTEGAPRPVIARATIQAPEIPPRPRENDRLEPAAAPARAPIREPRSQPAIPELQILQGFDSARVLNKVKPAYPEVASLAHVQGTVRLKATVGKDGAVSNVDVVSGPSLLVDAASDAVKQWTFTPATLNGDRVEDVIYVNVTFEIAQ